MNDLNINGNSHNNEEFDIPNHLVMAVLTTCFCCIPFGIIALVYAIGVNNAIIAKNFKLAKIYSDKAKYWWVLALTLGIAITLCAIFLQIIFIAVAGTVGLKH